MYIYNAKYLTRNICVCALDNVKKIKFPLRVSSVNMIKSAMRTGQISTYPKPKFLRILSKFSN